MSTAVIITGHARTFQNCIPTLRWHVLRHYEPLSFYVSTVKDEDSRGMYATLHALYPGAAVHIDEIDAQPDLPEPAEAIRFEPYARSVPVQAVLRQLWQLEQGWKFFEEAKHDDPDVVIRVRPDLFWHDFSRVEVDYPNQAFVPAWGCFGGVNDRFAVLGARAARAYFTTYSQIPTLMGYGCPLHPESLVKAALEYGGAQVSRDMVAVFSTLRKDGQVRPPEFSHVDLIRSMVPAGKSL